MSAGYKLLQPDQPDTTVQVVSHQDEKEDETKETELNYQKRNCLFLSTTLYLKSVDIEKQEFEVKGWIHVFWNDNYLLGKLLNNNNNNNSNTDDSSTYITLKYSDLSTEIQNHLPLNARDGYLFENSKIISFITDPIIEYTSNGAFRMSIQMESTFDEQFILNSYPKDAHILNIKLLYNHSKYQWQIRNKQNKETQWLQGYDESKVKLYNWDSRLSFAMYQSASTQWNALNPRLHFNKAFDFYLISFRIVRKSSRVICNVVVPLFLVIGCTFSIYGFSYYEWSMRLFLIFLSFMFTVIVHVIITVKKYALVSFVVFAYTILALMMAESMLLGLNIFKMNSENDMDTFDLVAAIVFGVLWLVRVIAALGLVNNRHYNEQYWKLRYRRQWTEWKNTKFIHIAKRN